MRESAAAIGDYWFRASASILEFFAVSRMNQQTASVHAITAVAYQ